MRLSLAFVFTLGIFIAAPIFAADQMPAPSAESTELQHRGVGVVNRIDLATHKINITHEPIKTLAWPAMTSDFVVQNPANLTELKPGQAVEFDLAKGARGYSIMRISPRR